MTRDGGELPIVRAEGFRKTYGTRVLAMRTEHDLRFMIANERVTVEGGGDFYLGEGMVILTPIAAKELVADLGRLVREWERDNGRIGDRPRKAMLTEQRL